METTSRSCHPQGVDPTASRQGAPRRVVLRWRPGWLVAALTLLVWAHSVTFDFVWDDQQFIVELEAVRSLRHAPEMFWRKEAQASLSEFNVFRPLRTVHYAVLFQLGGGEPPKPWLFHLANVLWHGMAAWLLLGVARRLFQTLTPGGEEASARRFALFVACGFAAHPVVSEVVCWAKSLDDAMAAVFTLAALSALLRWGDGGTTAVTDRHHKRALLWFALAVYSKESAVPFALAAPLVLRLCQRLDWRTVAVRSAGFFVIALVYMAHRHLVIGRSSQTEPISGSHGQTLVDMLPVVTEYARLMFGIPPFQIDYSFMPGGHALGSAAVMMGMTLLAGLLCVAVWALRSERWRVVGLGLAWCGLFLLPVSNLLPMMQYMAERFLYLPLIGWLLALGWLLLPPGANRWRGGLALALVVLWSGAAWERSWIWRDAVTLFVQSHLDGPPTTRVRNNAIASILGLPQVRTVFQHDAKDWSQVTFNSVASAEQLAAARTTLEEAVKLFPDEFSLHNNLGTLHAIAGRPAEAARCFEQAARLQPKRPELWANLGQARLEAKDHAGAQAALEQALAADSQNISAWKSRLRLEWERGDYAAALRVLARLRELEPGNPEHERWEHRAREQLKGD